MQSENKKRKITIYHFFNLSNLIILLVSLLIGAVVMILYVLFSHEQFTLYNFVNGSFVSSAILIASSLLYLASLFGTFDVISVGFTNLISVIKKNGVKKYDGIYGYQEAHEAVRESHRFRFLPILVAGLLFLGVSLMLYFIWKNNVNLV